MIIRRNLGEVLGAALENGPLPRTLAAQRERVLAGLTTSSSRAPSKALVLAVCASLAVAAAVFVAVRRPSPAAPEALRGAWQGRTLPEASRVAAPAEHGETLSFTDGSRVELQARAEVALSKLAPEQARL